MEKTRDKMVKIITEKIKDEKKAKNIEKSAFNYAIDCSETYDITPSWESHLFKHIYMCNINSVLLKLESKEIIESIKNKEISSKELATTDIDLINNKESEFEEEVSDGIFTCFKCNSKKTSYYSLQTRSADEPMTNFITCLKCKHRWKM